MSEPFIGQLMLVPYNFAPRGWADCDGQLLPISQNSALFSLIGTIYGGDGRTTFGLPDLRGRVPMHEGAGPGLSNRSLGEKGGAETVTLTATEIPGHTHSLGAVKLNLNSSTGTSTDGTGKNLAGHGTSIPPAGNWTDAATNAQSAAAALSGDTGSAGGSGSHNNMQPYLTMRWVIALTGVFPSRS